MMKGLFSRYAGAAGLVALALVVRLGLTQTMGVDYIYMTFFPAFLLSAMLGGVGPGLFATALSTILACWFFDSTQGELAIERNADAVGLFGFAATGALVSLVAEGFYGYLKRQIADRDRATEARGRSEELLQQTMRVAGLGIFEHDHVNDVIWSSPRALELCGLPPDEPMTISSLLERIHPEDRDRIRLAIKKAHDPAGHGDYEVETRILKPEGSICWISVRSRTFFTGKGEARRPVRTVGAILDVTAQVKATTALQGQNWRLSLLNAAAVRLLSAADPDTVMPAIYHAIAEFFQTSGFFEFAVDKDELVLRTALGVGEPEKECGIKRLKIGEAVVGLVAQQREPVVLSHADRLENPQAVFLKELAIRAYACYPLIAGERLLGTLSFASRQRDRFEVEDQEFFQTLASYLALARERARLSQELRRYTENLENLVTERTAKLRELVNELQYMSYSIVHDLRAPLRAIQSFAAIISLHEAERLGERSRELFDRIIAATNRMDLLITDVLNYNKTVGSGLNLQPVNANGLLQDVLQSSPEFQPPRADIRLETPVPWVWAEKAGLMQCFSNLLANSVKFVRPGTTPSVRIHAETDKDQVRIWFKDEGIGIPPESREKIFLMFERAHGPEYEGTGMGLALVRKIVEKMGGGIGVESEEGKGSRFWLQFRAADERELLPESNHASENWP